jgi:hypothetical protein
MRVVVTEKAFHKGRYLEPSNTPIEIPDRTKGKWFKIVEPDYVPRQEPEEGQHGFIPFASIGKVIPASFNDVMKKEKNTAPAPEPKRGHVKAEARNLDVLTK